MRANDKYLSHIFLGCEYQFMIYDPSWKDLKVKKIENNVIHKSFLLGYQLLNNYYCNSPAKWE